MKKNNAPEESYSRSELTNREELTKMIGISIPYKPTCIHPNLSSHLIISKKELEKSNKFDYWFSQVYLRLIKNIAK